jgi:hypothetical protein
MYIFHAFYIVVHVFNKATTPFCTNRCAYVFSKIFSAIPNFDTIGTQSQATTIIIHVMKKIDDFGPHILLRMQSTGMGKSFPFYICLMKNGNKKDSSYLHLNQGRT